MNILTNIRATETSFINLASDGLYWRASEEGGGVSSVLDSPYQTGDAKYSIGLYYNFLYLPSLYTFDLSKDFTIALWNKRIATGEHLLIGDGSHFHSIWYSDSYKYCIRIEYAYSYAAPSFTVSNSNWNYIALVNHDNYQYYFINGILVERMQSIYSYLYSVGYSGFNGDGTRNTGLIDDFIIVDEALWTSNFKPPTSYLFNNNNSFFENNDNIYGILK